MFGSTREELRKEYLTAWRNHQQNKPLQPHQILIVAVLQMHPEYQSQIDDQAIEYKDFDGSDGQTNPFLHMGMHIAIHEQLKIGLPKGIGAIHQKLSRKLGDIHAAEHRMLECLGETLWTAQRDKREPDMGHYVNCLKKALR